VKYADIQILHEAGLITDEQRQNIIAHYDLKEEGGKYLAIVSIIGAVLITAGIILLKSAYWNAIPRGLKIAMGVALMLGAHGAGWWLREVHGKYRKTGEALHLVGAGLFLANIALLGQIYNLSSRLPNAFLLWFAHDFLLWFAFVLALQGAWMLATTFTQERALRVGQLIMLETRPVDPRDLLRGDFVILNYKISDVTLSAFTPARTNAPADGTTIYVALAPVGTNSFYEIMRASTEPLEPVAGQVLMQGQSRHGWGNGSTVRVEYGLERYYVSEGTGNPRGKLTVQAAVSKSGRATIKEVFVDGKPYIEAMKEPVK
jgi:uncharacterized membrane-anchored protein